MITQPGDLMLLYHKEAPAGFARVEEITADVKPGWWQVRLLLLQLPISQVTWILREEYIDGAEFTMGGNPLRLERLPGPGSAAPDQDETPEPPEDGQNQGKVISLSRRSRKKG